MNSYEKLVSMMLRNNVTSPVCVGIMDSATTCHTETGLSLDTGDLLIADHLKTRYVKNVTLVSNQLNVEYIEPLKQGDTVVLCQLNDDIYAILERVV